MKLRRIVIQDALGSGRAIILTGEHYNYLINVIRVRRGDEFELLDSSGAIHRCMVVSIQKGSLIAECLHVQRSCSVLSQASALAITLVCSIIKGKRFPFILQKGAELGVSMFLPLITDRTIPRDFDFVAKTARWKKIVLEAVKQCERIDCPEVLPPVKPEEALALTKENELKLLLHERGERPVGEVLKRFEKRPKGIALAIGPEGGFSQNDAMIFINGGYEPVSLGREILRAETAVVASLSIIKYHFGILG